MTQSTEVVRRGRRPALPAEKHGHACNFEAARKGVRGGNLGFPHDFVSIGALHDPTSER